MSDRTMLRSSGFLSLPAELRNEIYSYIFDTNEEPRLRLKLKANASGDVYAKTKTPALAHVFPALREEIESVFYGVNNLRVNLSTAQKRLAFRIWIQQRQEWLKDLTSLTLLFKAKIEAKGSKSGHFSGEVNSHIRLERDGRGGLIVRQRCDNSIPFCRPCRSRRFIHFDWELAELNNDIDASEVYGVQEATSPVNSIVEFAVKISNILDAVAQGQMNIEHIQWLRNANQMTMCWNCQLEFTTRVL